MPRDSFILYREQKEIFKNLSNEQAGKLIKAIFEYIDTGNEIELDETLKIAFIPIKQQLDRNEIKWQEIKKKRSQAGKIGMQKRWNNDITKITNDNKCYQMITNDNKTYQDITKITVNDNVNVNVNDNIKENIKRKVFVAPTLEEVQNYISEKGLNVDGKQFFDYFTEGNWKDSKGNQVKNWKQKLLTWNRYTISSNNKQTKRIANYEQRNYENLDSLYAN